jgi:hypothetical protein
MVPLPTRLFSHWSIPLIKAGKKRGRKLEDDEQCVEERRGEEEGEEELTGKKSGRRRAKVDEKRKNGWRVEEKLLKDKKYCMFDGKAEGRGDKEDEECMEERKNVWRRGKNEGIEERNEEEDKWAKHCTYIKGKVTYRKSWGPQCRCLFPQWVRMEGGCWTAGRWWGRCWWRGSWGPPCNCTHTKCLDNLNF